mmetsp:Transcript_87742/g.228924  ORF Transcript_87742/g.228924 Transcript_87742/m.228924 type:complete len:345 (+) Transcript_87742:127-1161(+)
MPDEKNQLSAAMTIRKRATYIELGELGSTLWSDQELCAASSGLSRASRRSCCWRPLAPLAQRGPRSAGTPRRTVPLPGDCLARSAPGQSARALALPPRAAQPAGRLARAPMGGRGSAAAAGAPRCQGRLPTPAPTPTPQASSTQAQRAPIRLRRCSRNGPAPSSSRRARAGGGRPPAGRPGSPAPYPRRRGRSARRRSRQPQTAPPRTLRRGAPETTSPAPRSPPRRPRALLARGAQGPARRGRTATRGSARRGAPLAARGRAPPQRATAPRPAATETRPLGWSLEDPLASALAVGRRRTARRGRTPRTSSRTSWRRTPAPPVRCSWGGRSPCRRSTPSAGRGP